VALLVLPWLLLAADPQWVYSGMARDTWAYFGGYLDLPGCLRTFNHYTLGRLSVLLPGWAAYSLLPAVAANLVLHVGVYSAGVLSGYAALARTVGRRAALLAMSVLGGNWCYLRAAGGDYIDGYAVAYFLMAAAALAAAAGPGRFWRWWAFAGGAAAAAVVTAYLALVVMILPLVGFFLAANRHGGRHPRDAAGFWVGAGFAAGLAGFAVASRALGGPLLFLLPSVTFAQSFGAADRAVFFHDPGLWLHRAGWLLLPAAAAAGAVVALARAGLRGGSPLATYFQLQFLVLAGLLWYAQLAGHTALLQYRPHATATVAVTGALALAGQWSAWLGRFTPGGFRTLAAAWFGVVVLSCVDPGRFNVSDWGRLVPLPAALACVVGSAVFAQLAPARVWAGVVVVGLLAVGSMAARGYYWDGLFTPGVKDPIRQDRYEEYESRRSEVFRSVSATARWANGLAPPGRVWFWYNLDDPHGPVCDMAAHTNYFTFQIVNPRFPDLADGKLYCGNPVQMIARQGGAVVVFSDDPAAAAKALDQLRRSGLRAELSEVRVTGHPPFAYTATVIWVAPG
jgi:hypothetical protein